jgi:hypothetical protein
MDHHYLPIARLATTLYRCVVGKLKYYVGKWAEGFDDHVSIMTTQMSFYIFDLSSQAGGEKVCHEYSPSDAILAVGQVCGEQCRCA